MIDSYDKLTIGKWYEMKEILEEGSSDAEKQIRLLSLLCDKTEDEILDLPLEEYENLSEGLDFLTNEPKIGSRIPDKIRIGDTTYKVLKDVSKMTAGQYIDIQTYMSNNLGIEYVLSCVLIPEGKKYGEVDALVTIDNIKKNLSVTTATSISGFFQKRLLRSIRTTLIYLDWRIRMVERQARKTQNPEMVESLKETRRKLKEMVSQVNGVGSSL